MKLADVHTQMIIYIRVWIGVYTHSLKIEIYAKNEKKFLIICLALTDHIMLFVILKGKLIL